MLIKNNRVQWAHTSGKKLMLKSRLHMSNGMLSVFLLLMYL